MPGLAVANAGRVSRGCGHARRRCAVVAWQSAIRARVAALALALLARRLVVGERPARRARPERARSVTSARPRRPPSSSPARARDDGFDLRVPARIVRFGGLVVREPVLLELPVGRSPPQGAILELDARLKLPRPASHGFDERTWLRRHGVHVVAVGKEWRVVGHRGGVGGYADRVRAWLARSLAPGLGGRAARGPRGHRARRGRGAVAGAPGRLPGLGPLPPAGRQRPERASSSPPACSASRWVSACRAGSASSARSPGSASYVLAVGAQPSVIRAGIAGALGSIAWLAARQRDRWHFLLVGALILLAWNPYTLLDAGFQLSFAAVVGDLRRASRAPSASSRATRCRSSLGEAVAVSLACGLATAPVLWLQFGRIPLYSVPANALAAPVVAPLLGLVVRGGARRRRSRRRSRPDRVRERLAGRLPRLVRAARRRPARGGRLVDGGPRRAAPGRLVARCCSPLGRRPLPGEGLTMLARRGGRAEGGIPAHGERPPEGRARPPPTAGAVRRGLGRAALGTRGIGRGRGRGLQRDGPVRRGRPARARRRGRALEGARREGGGRVPRRARRPTRCWRSSATELRKDSPLAKACAKAGDSLAVRGVEAGAAEMGRGAVRTRTGVQGRVGGLPRAGRARRREPARAGGRDRQAGGLGRPATRSARTRSSCSSLRARTCRRSR